MLTYLRVLPLLATLLVTADAQVTPPKAPAAPSDRSREAFVVEHFSRKETFENDGTSVAEETSRVRIQSDAGVKRYGLLSFRYASGTTSLDIRYVRVRRADGSVVETPPEGIQEMAAQITREAPFYSDLREKHVAVKGLSVGDILEYQVSEHTTKPLAPGHFWTSYEFTREQFVLDEEFEVSVPRDRKIKVKSTASEPVERESGAYHVYTWHSQNLTHSSDENDKRKATENVWLAVRGRTPRRHVLLSSFGSWEEVGRWYSSLQDERVKPTPQVTAKALEITKGAQSEDEKIRKIYSYVSTQFRYIGVALGIGRYQPHGADAVLENQFGDCKDKHTLFASLLAALNIQAFPALISSTHELDPDVPSPEQFDHVVTVVPRNGSLVWLDTTPEVGPYQYLLSPLRDKYALVVWKDKAPELARTPVDSPLEETQTFDMDAKLSDAGSLEGKAELTARGDVEFWLRAGFRAVPLPQWNELGKRISQTMGFGGDVSELTASSPEDMSGPFRMSYKYTRKEFGDWSNRRTLAPDPVMGLLAPAEEDSLPLGPSWLGSPQQIHFHSQMELPSGYRAEIPSPIHLKRDFAEYDSVYEMKDGKLISDRNLKTLLREVPASERELYKEFAKKIEDDYGTFIPLVSPGSAESAVTRTGSMAHTTGAEVASLPGSSNPEAARLESEARDAVAKRDMQSAVSSLYRATGSDPNFVRAWVLLGVLLLSEKQMDAGKDAFQKAMALAPQQPVIPKTLGMSLIQLQRFDDALQVWQDYAKAHPEDMDGAANLGVCLFKLNRFAEAAAAYEAALKLKPDDASLLERVASSYLSAGNREKATAAFNQLGVIDKDGVFLNDAAYTLAGADLNLPVALKYAQQATRKAEEATQKISLDTLNAQDLRQVIGLAARWDTLGWVSERMSDMTSAEQYLRAAWNLTQDGVVAGHLCHLYRRTHQISTAIGMCRLAIQRIPLSQNLSLAEYPVEIAAAKENLEKLGAAPQSEKFTSGSADVAIRERTFKLPRFLPGNESAEFFVLLATDGKDRKFKVQDVKYISGSDKMKLQGKQLKAIDFNITAPDSVPSRIVRRGILGCYEYTGCSFVLLDQATVHAGP